MLLSFGKRELKSFAPSGKLYIVCHGHEALPIFTNSMGKWTAENIAEMLELDGLSKEQQVIELLVCYAGLSVNSIERLKKIQALQSEAARLGAGKEQSAAIAALVRMQKEPSELKPYSNPQQVMPLANQLFNALTSRGYTKLKLISYKAKVSQAIDANGVLVDLPGYAGPKSVKHLPGIIHVLEQAKPSGSSSSSASSSSNG
ncbi:hypothetical protein [uncultured Fibrella sp.]|uniref:hypothetical protein n=1 Tax=uncultured Fibrella sp. TaxID=1284596 RepID=UPI0035C9F524